MKIGFKLFQSNLIATIEDKMDGFKETNDKTIIFSYEFYCQIN